jgi:hypothetical protein
MADKYRDLIITAASESYRPQLLAFLGSLRCNWPDHPPVIVYDMGLCEETSDVLCQAGFNVRAIPHFVPHWRKHYTWKPWCMNDAPGECVLWLDAGDCILRPVPEVFEIIRQQGYFAVPNYRPLEIEASEDACEGCGVPLDFRTGKVSLAAGVFGFQGGSAAENVVRECLEVALTERYIRASNPWHRHDQAILSLLMYRDISPLILCDGPTYFCEDLTAKFTTHSIWAGRRFMHYKDLQFFASCLSGPVSRHIPRSSHKLTLWFKSALLMKNALNAVLRLLGRPSGSIDGVK